MDIASPEARAEDYRARLLDSINRLPADRSRRKYLADERRRWSDLYRWWQADNAILPDFSEKEFELRLGHIAVQLARVPRRAA